MANDTPPQELGDHAILDRASRQAKGRKIRDILADRLDLKGRRILDVGTGSGFAAGVFLEEVGTGGQVCAVDRINQLQEAGIEFRATATTDIPYEDGQFDIVMTNHVIEHVGDRDQQSRHLAEIKRVLRDDGVIYLAVPNRWAPWEHHFDLPLLGWFPPALASRYVRAMRRGTHYDCKPLSRGELAALFEENGLIIEDVTLQALRLMAEKEMGPLPRKVIGACPDLLLRLPMAFIPTLVALGSKA